MAERGVKYYTHGVGRVVVHFPEDRTYCQWCPYCRNEDSLRRWRCLLTDEYIVYPFTARGLECPLEVEERDGQSINL